MKIKRYAFLIWVLSLLSAIVLYSWMPSTIAVHWNLSGNVDIEMGRFWGAFLVPAILSVIYALYHFVSTTGFYKDKFSENTEVRLAVHVSVLITFLVCYFAQLMIYSIALGWEVSAIRIVLYFLAILMIGLGSVVKMSGNKILGLQNQWTRKSATVRKKVNYLFSIVMLTVGTLLFLSLFFIRSYDEILLKAFIFCLFASAVSLHLYSKIVWSKSNGK